MTYQELLALVEKEGVLPVKIVCSLRRVDGDVKINSIRVALTQLVYFINQDRWEKITPIFPVLVVSTEVNDRAIVTGYLYKSNSELLLSGFDTSDKTPNYFANVSDFSYDQISKVMQRHEVDRMLSNTEAYFGSLIDDALKTEFKQFSKSLNDIVWEGVDTLNIAVEVAKTAQVSFKKYLNNYCKYISNKNKTEDYYKNVFTKFEEFAEQVKMSEDTLVYLIEKLCPPSTKTLKPLVPRRKISRLIVKQYGYGCFKIITGGADIKRSISRFITALNVSLSDDEHEQLSQVAYEVNNIGQLNEVTKDDNWATLLAKSFTLLMDKDIVALSLFTLFSNISVSDITKIRDTLYQEDLRDISALTLIEENPYVISFLGCEVDIGVLDFFAFANGTIGRVGGTKGTIVNNMRKALSIKDCFDDLANNDGDTTVLISEDFFKKDSTIKNKGKSILDICITADRAGKLLHENGYTELYNMRVLNTYNSYTLKKIAERGVYIDTLLKEERDPIEFIFGEFYKPTSIPLSYRGIWQYGAGKGQKISLIATTELERKNILNIAEKTGIITGIKINDEIYFGNTNIYSDEEFIFNAINKLKARKLNIEQDILEKALADFEKEKGFTLEGKQRQAPLSANNNIIAITGAAGSGKTTTAEAVVKAVEYGGANNIFFAAPTGKAANRLREVVNRNVSTIHSLFKIQGDDDDDKESKKLDADCLIIDEGAMIPTKLMAKVLKGIDLNKTQLILIGDIEQLSPIGAGKPFAELIDSKYVTVIELDVVKRCAEGSMVTRNANIIIGKIPNEKVRTDTEKLKFIVLDMKPNPIDKFSFEQQAIMDLVLHHTGRTELAKLIKNNGHNYFIRDMIINNEQFDADDITIVTPIKKASHSLGTTQLNKLLQEIMNPESPAKTQVISDLGGKTIYRVNDRIIHTKNDYKKVRYVRTEDGKFTEHSLGIMNGEVGKLVLIESLDRIRDLYQVNKEIDATVKEKGEDILDSSYEYLVGVEYQGIDNSGEFYKFIIFYGIDAKEKESDSINNQVVYGETVLIEHAYALTVHKMQGSQSRCIIAPVFDMYEGLMSRNMVYTAITRSKDVAYLIGDIYGTADNPSAFEKMLERQATNERTSLLGKLMLAEKEKDNE